VVPFPEPPPGPKISRVAHDALRPIRQGDRVAILVDAEPGLAVTVAIGSVVRDLACPPKAGEPGAYRCEAALPFTAIPGSHRVIVKAVDAKGRASTLSAVLPVVVRAYVAWEEPNALNMRLRPAYFAAGSSDLDDAARDALRKNVELLMAHANFPILIEGHGDSGEEGDRKALSVRRAEAVLGYLVTLGVPKVRMSVVGAGDDQMVVRSAVAEERAANRRVMVLLEPDRSPDASNPPPGR